MGNLVFLWSFSIATCDTQGNHHDSPVKASPQRCPPCPPAPARSRPHRSGPWQPRRQSPGAPGIFLQDLLGRSVRIWRFPEIFGHLQMSILRTNLSGMSMDQWIEKTCQTLNSNTLRKLRPLATNLRIQRFTDEVFSSSKVDAPALQPGVPCQGEISRETSPF